MIDFWIISLCLCNDVNWFFNLEEDDILERNKTYLSLFYKLGNIFTIMGNRLFIIHLIERLFPFIFSHHSIKMSPKHEKWRCNVKLKPIENWVLFFLETPRKILWLLRNQNIKLLSNLSQEEALPPIVFNYKKWSDSSVF